MLMPVPLTWSQVKRKYVMRVTHFCCECEVIPKVTDVVLQQEDQTLVETVVFTLHICVSAKLIAIISTYSAILLNYITLQSSLCDTRSKFHLGIEKTFSKQ